MNALSYLKNVGKSFGYAAVDIYQNLNPTTSSYIAQGKEFSEDLYESVKSFKAKAKDANNNSDSLLGLAKSTAKDTIANSISDLRTGKWYNKQRYNEVVGETVADEEGLNFDNDFDWDDWDNSDNEESSEDKTTMTAANMIMSANSKNSISEIRAMDRVGRKMTTAIGMSTIQSAQYMGEVNKTGFKQMLKLNNKGFAGVMSGISAVNANISSLLQLGEPITTHINNAANFYTKTNEYQDKVLEKLDTIITTITPKKERSENQTGTMFDLINSDGGIDIENFKNLIKNNAKDSTIGSYVSLFLSMANPKEIASMIKSNPVGFILRSVMSASLSNKFKESQKRIDKTISQLSVGLLNKLRKGTTRSNGGLRSDSDSIFGRIFNGFLDLLTPKDSYRERMDTNNYQKGKVDWDGKSRKALMEVIPTYLAEIDAALTGKPVRMYDYNSGTWKTLSSINNNFESMRKNVAKNNAGGYVDGLMQIASGMVSDKRMNASQKKQLEKELDEFITNAFHSNDSDYLGVAANYKSKKESDAAYEKIGKKMGLSKDTWELLQLYNKVLSKNGKASTRNQLETDIELNRDSWTRQLKYMEGNDSIYQLLFNGMSDYNLPKKGKDVGNTKELLRNANNPFVNLRDEYNNNIFFYLQNIFRSTDYLARNANKFVSPVAFETVGNGSKKDTVRLSPAIDLSFKSYKPYTSEIRRSPTPKNTVADENQNKIDDAKSKNNVNTNVGKYKESDIQRQVDMLNGFDEDEYIRSNISKRDDLDEMAKLKVINYYNNKKNGSTPTNKKYDEYIKQASAGKYAARKAAEFNNNWNGFFGGTKLGKSIDNISDTIANGMESIVSDWVYSNVPFAAAFKNAFIGEKGSNGKYNDNKVLSKFANELHDAKNNARDVFHIGNNPNDDESGSGSGLSAGKSGMSKRKRRKRLSKEEIQSKADQILSDAQEKADKTLSEVEDKAAETKDKVTKSLNDTLKSSTKFISNVIKETYGQDGKYNKAGSGVENVKKIVKASAKEAGLNKGSMLTGALIGGGAGLLTGTVIGPIAGAAIGAGIGLVKKSTKIQNLLFGEVVDEETGARANGMLPRKLADFILNNAGAAAHGGRAAVAGMIGGAFLGSPILGSIAGAAAGFVTHSANASSVLFGEEDDLGNKTKLGFFNKLFKNNKSAKQLTKGNIIGGIGGALAGSMLFHNPYGIAGGIIIGSALGMASDMNKFKEKMFGKEVTKKDRNGKEYKTYEGGLFGLIKTQIVDPLAGIINKGAHMLGEDFKNFRKRIAKWIRRRLARRVLPKIKKIAQKTAVGRLGTKLINFGKKAAVKLNPLNIINNKLERKALRKGYIFDDNEGNFADAAYRLERMKELGMNTDTIQGQFYQILSEATPEEAEKLSKIMQNGFEPDKEQTKQMGQSRSIIAQMLRSKNLNLDYDSRKALRKAFKKGNYEDAIKAANGNETLINEITKYQKAEADRGKVNGEEEQALKELFKNKTFGSKLKSLFRNGKISLTENQRAILGDFAAEEAKNKKALNEFKENDSNENVKATKKNTDIIAEKTTSILDEVKQIKEAIYSRRKPNSKKSRRRGKSKNNNADENVSETTGASFDATSEHESLNTGLADDIKDTVNDKISEKISESMAANKEAESTATDTAENQSKSKAAIGTFIKGIGSKIKGLFTKSSESAGGSGLNSYRNKFFSAGDSGIDNNENNNNGEVEGVDKDTRIINTENGAVKQIKTSKGWQNDQESALTNKAEKTAKMKNKFYTSVAGYGIGIAAIAKNTKIIAEGLAGSAKEKKKGLFDTLKDIFTNKNSLFGKIKTLLGSGLANAGIGGIGRAIGGSPIGTSGLGTIIKAIANMIGPAIASALFIAAVRGKFDKWSEKYLGTGKTKEEKAVNTNGSATATTPDGKTINLAVNPDGTVATNSDGDYVDANTGKSISKKSVTNVKNGSAKRTQGASWTGAVARNSNGKLEAIAVNPKTGKFEKNSTGQYISSNGTLLNDQITYTGSTSTDALSTRIIKQTARGALTGTPTLASGLVNYVGNGILKTAGVKGSTNVLLRKGVDKVAGKALEAGMTRSIGSTMKEAGAAAVKESAKDATVGGIGEMVHDQLQSLFEKLSKLPFVKGCSEAVTQSGDEITEQATKAVEKGGPELATKTASAMLDTVLFVAKVATVIYDFEEGYNDAYVTLHVSKPTTGQKIISGLIRAVKNLVPFIGMLIPDSLLVKIFVKYIAPAFGVDTSSFLKQQQEADEELEKYNKKNNTNYTWEEYQKQVKNHYTIGERVGNAVKTGAARVATGAKKFGSKVVSAVKAIPGLAAKAGNTIKTGAGRIATGAKKFGSKVVSEVKAIPGLAVKAGTAVKNGITTGASFVVNGAKKVGSKVVSGVQAIPGIVGTGLKSTGEFIEDKASNITTAFKGLGSALIHTRKYALTGDISNLVKSKYKSMNKDDPYAGLYSSIFNIDKILTMPMAGVSWIGHKTASGIGSIVGNFTKNISSLTTSLDKMKKYAKNGKIGSIAKTKTEFSSNDGIMNGMFTILGTVGKVFYTIIGGVNTVLAPVKKLFGSVKNTITSIADKIKNFVTGGSDKEKSSDSSNSGGGSGLSGGASFISQKSSSNSGKSLGSHSVGDMGCGPASAAMALGSSDMDSAIDSAKDYQTSGGTDASFFGDYFKSHGRTANYMRSTSSIADSIASGTPTVLMGRDSSNTSKANSPFGPKNHYVVAKGFDHSGNIIVNDPEQSHGNTKYSSSILKNVLLGVGAGKSGIYKSRRRHKLFGISAGDSGNSDAYAEAIWKYFLSQGMSPYEAAGILGNWKTESGINPESIEGDYMFHPNWDDIMNNPEAAQNYAVNKLFPLYARQGVKINKSAYKDKNGYYFPGGGLAQWTGPGISSLLDFAKANNLKSNSLSAQIGFFLNGSGEYNSRSDLISAMRGSANSKQAADYFYSGFESGRGVHAGLRDARRENNAQAIYDRLKDVKGDASAIENVGTGSSGSSSSSSSDSGKSAGLLGTILNAFSVIGNVLNGGDNTGSNTNSTGSASSYGIDSSNDPVSKMESILGKISYSMEGPRNPDAGSADCSSTVNWAIKKSGGPDIGGYTGAQQTSTTMDDVVNGKGATLTQDQLGGANYSKLKRDDVLFFVRDYAKNNPTFPYGVGHVGLYMGDGRYIDHGSGMGPKIKPMPGSGLTQVRRLKPENAPWATSSSSSSSSNNSSHSNNTPLVAIPVNSGSGSGLSDTQKFAYNYDSNNYDFSDFSAGDSGLLSNTKSLLNTAKYTSSIGATGRPLMATNSTPASVTINNNNTTMPAISNDKSTALLLKTIITLVEQLVTNTDKVDAIYSVISQNISAAIGGSNMSAEQQAKVLALSKQYTDNTIQSTANANTHKELYNLKHTIDQILAG